MTDATEPTWPAEPTPPTGSGSWEWAASGAFEVVERCVAFRRIEAIERDDEGSEGFLLGNLRAALAAAVDFPDEAFVRVVRPKKYEADEEDRNLDEHWFDGVVIEQALGSRRIELMRAGEASAAPDGEDGRHGR